MISTVEVTWKQMPMLQDEEPTNNDLNFKLYSKQHNHPESRISDTETVTQ